MTSRLTARVKVIRRLLGGCSESFVQIVTPDKKYEEHGRTINDTKCASFFLGVTYLKKKNRLRPALSVRLQK